MNETVPSDLARRDGGPMPERDNDEDRLFPDRVFPIAAEGLPEAATSTCSVLHNLGRRAGGLLAINIVGAGLALLSHIVLARMLGPSSYGVYVYALAWVSILALLAQVGTEPLVVRQVSAYQALAQWPLLHGLVRFCRFMVSGVGLFLAVLVCLATLTLRDRISAELVSALWVTAATIPVLALLQLHQALLTGLHRPLASGIIGNIIRPSLLLLILLAVYFTGSALDAVIAMASNLVAVSLILALAMGWYGRSRPIEIAGVSANYAHKAWLSSGLMLLLIHFTHVVLNQADIIMIGAMLGTESAAIYAPAAKIASVVIFSMIAVNTVVAPMIAQAYAAGQRSALRRLLPVAIVASASVALPLVVVICLFADELLALFGPAFAGGRQALIILAVAQLFNVLAGPVDYYLIMTRFERLALTVLGVSAALNVLLNIIFIPRYGIEGAAMATAISMIAWNLGMLAVVRLKLRISPFVYDTAANP